MATGPRQKLGKAGFLWLFVPEDTTSGSGLNKRVNAFTRLNDCLKAGFWIIISILAGLAIGQL